MARVPFVTDSEAPPEVRAIYDGQKRVIGKTLNTTRVRAHCPSLLVGIAAMQATQEKSACAPAALKPLVTLLVSRLNGCPH